jgi:hypothetical protein
MFTPHIIMILSLVSIAIAMRLYGLGYPFDFDGYDEGVYWQTLRAMRAGSKNVWQTNNPQILGRSICDC